MLSRCSKWLADSARLVGAAFYWNTRKSLYQLKGHRGRCPCQNESDDSIPGRVRCDAMVHWNDPARFRRVCPLLVSTPDGWRCSVHATAVRPFWGRVIAGTLVSLATLYLVCVLGAFAFLRVVSGTTITLTQVALPSRWWEIRRTQSDDFLARAAKALAAGKFSEAYLSVTSACERDPDNYPAALLLAKLTMFQGSILHADAQFEDLIRTRPADSAETALFYHDTLVQTDRMDRLGALTLHMAVTDTTRASVWMRSALLALRSMAPAQSAALRKAAAGDIAALAPHARQLWEAECALRDGDRLSASALLRSRSSGPVNPFYTAYQIVRCAELGMVEDAQLLIDFYGPTLGDFEQQVLQYRVSRLAKDADGAKAAWASLLAGQLTQSRVERLLGTLIAMPDRQDFGSFATRVHQTALDMQQRLAGELALCAIVCGARDEAVTWLRMLSPEKATSLSPLAQVNFGSRDPQGSDSPIFLLNVLPLSRETIDALLLRTAPQMDARSETGAHSR